MSMDRFQAPERIVLIDDDPTYRRILAHCAAEEGVELDVFESLMDLGSVGLLGRYDAAIVDYDLGELSGPEIGEYVSALFRDLPLLLVSSKPRDDEGSMWPDSIRKFVNKGQGYSYTLMEAVRLARAAAGRARIGKPAAARKGSA